MNMSVVHKSAKDDVESVRNNKRGMRKSLNDNEKLEPENENKDDLRDFSKKRRKMMI